MKSPTFKLASMLGVMAFIGTVVVLAGTNNPELSQIAGYREWTRLSETPKTVFDTTSFAG